MNINATSINNWPGAEPLSDLTQNISNAIQGIECRIHPPACGNENRLEEDRERLGKDEHNLNKDYKRCEKDIDRLRDDMEDGNWQAVGGDLARFGKDLQKYGKDLQHYDRDQQKYQRDLESEFGGIRPLNEDPFQSTIQMLSQGNLR